MEEVSWDNFVAPLDQIAETLGRAWSIVNHLNSVVDTPELRAVQREPAESDRILDRTGPERSLFGKYKRCGRPEFASLSPARGASSTMPCATSAGGAELPEDKKERLAPSRKNTRPSHAFLRKRAGRHQRPSCWSRRSRAGRPAGRREGRRARRRRESRQAGYEFSLHFPSYYPILQFADSRALRETIYRANATKASDQGDVFSKKDWDNTQNIVTLLRLRDEEAKLLGYDNFAEVSLVPKMAKSPAQVIAFLEDLASARPFAEKDLAELKQFAREELGLDELQAWDVPTLPKSCRNAATPSRHRK
jgi:oligopeptidase A